MSMTNIQQTSMQTNTRTLQTIVCSTDARGLLVYILKLLCQYLKSQRRADLAEIYGKNYLLKMIGSGKNDRENKVITTMMIRSLDDPT